MFLPAAGGCFYGEVSFSSDNGCYWSSTPYGGDANYLDFYSNLQYMAVNNRNGGYSVRAVQKGGGWAMNRICLRLLKQSRFIRADG